MIVRMRTVIATPRGWCNARHPYSEPLYPLHFMMDKSTLSIVSFNSSGTVGPTL